MANLEVDIELTTSGGQSEGGGDDDHHENHFQSNVLCSIALNRDINPPPKSLEEVSYPSENVESTDCHILDSDDGVRLNGCDGGQLMTGIVTEEGEQEGKTSSLRLPNNVTREGTSSDCFSKIENESEGDVKRASKYGMPNCDHGSVGDGSISQSVSTSNADSGPYGECCDSDARRSLATILGGSDSVSDRSSTSVAADCDSEMLPIVDRIDVATNGVDRCRSSSDEGVEVESEESDKTFFSTVSRLRLPEEAASVNDDEEDIVGENGFVVVSQCCDCGEEMNREAEAEEETEEVLSRDLAPCIDEAHRPFSDEVDSVGSERGDIVDLEDGDVLKLGSGMDLVDAVVGSSGGVSSRSSSSSAGSSGDVEIEEDIVVSEGDGSPKSSKDKTVMKRKQFVDTKLHCLGKKRCFSSSLECDSITTNIVALEKTVGSSVTVPGITQIQTLKKRIPTKDNPPPELAQWLTTFQCWSNAERLLALDQVIELCDPTQVRHMMCVIEPQFQRDFISLLPKELALYVLSFLEPKDLLRAAQTCKYWRILAEDNLLWREKCREAGIDEAREVLNKRRPKAGLVPSLWKVAYMRQHDIEMNWRYRPIRSPKVLKGHDDHVITCLQFCGSRIVSGSDDNTLKVWSATTGKCLKTLVGHTGGVWSSQMSGSVIVSGSTDRTLKVWNADTGQCIHTLYGHTSTVRCMHLHGHKVVSGSRDSTLRLWDIGTGLCLRVLLGHVAAVRCVQYDGRLVVSGAYDYTVKVWNPEREECLHTLQGHTNRVYSLQFDGVHVVSGSLDTSIRVWDVETGACKHTLMGHQSLTSGMELKNNILVSGNADSTVKVWDIMTGQCLQTLSGPNKHNSAVTCLQFNSKFVITSSDDGTVKLWDLKTGEFIRNLVTLDSGGSGGVVWRIRASPTKLVCAVGSRNGTEETKLLVLDFDADQK